VSRLFTRILLKFFRWFCHPDLQASIEGDLMEIHEERVFSKGARHADILLLRDVLLLFRPSIIKPASGTYRMNNYGMFNNHVKVGLRNILKHKGYSVINIGSLAIGLTFSFLVVLFLIDEFSYDRFHKDGDRMYRITKSYFNGDKTVETVPFRSYLLDQMQSDISAIESTTSLKPFSQKQRVKIGESTYTEERLAFVDSHFFDFFSFQLLSGFESSVLAEPYTLVISKSKADKYFPGDSPIGKVISINGAFDEVGFEAKITGVFQDMPENSHFHFDFLISMVTGDLENDKRGIKSFAVKYGYLKLWSGRSIEEVEALIPEIEAQYAPPFFAAYDMHLKPQALFDIHLRSKMQEELDANGDILQVWIFSGVALLTLLIACFNYVNLATARASEKRKEISVRRAIGSSRKQLVAQFMIESILTAFLALFLAVGLVMLILPFFNAFSGKALELSPSQIQVIMIFILITILTGSLSGMYPAIDLSRKKKGNSFLEKPQFSLRKILMVLQFSISSILIVVSLVIYGQWHLISDQQFAFDSSEIVNIPVKSKKIRDDFKTLKSELLKFGDIKIVTGSNKTFISKLTSFNGLTISAKEGFIDMYYAAIDADFFELYEKKFVSGRGFIEYSTDSINGIVINESAARLIGKSPDEIIGLSIDVYDGYSPKVIGVVEDFQFQSLHAGVVPMYFQLFYTKEIVDHLEIISLKVNTNHLSETLGVIEQTLGEFDQNIDFEYSFLDRDIGLAYEKEEKFSKIFTLITGIAILIACMGVFGITTAITNQRKKEFGVRKVLGASFLNIGILINKDFVILIMIANLFAFPIAYFLMTNWLQTFSQQIEIGVRIFMLATITSLFIAMLGSVYWSVKAAISNPVDSLKNE